MSDKVDRYRHAVATQDFAALGELRHPDYTCTYPQSGERFVGHDKWVAAHVDYSARFGDQRVAEAKVKGGAQKTKVTSAPATVPFLASPIVQVSDTGDLATLEGAGEWPDGKTYHWVSILEYRDGLVWRETMYFAEPFPAPDWRAEFTADPDWAE